MGTKTTPKRRWGLAAVFAVAVNAGTIESSSGRATVAPIPRKNVRRGNDRLVMNIGANSPQKTRLAADFTAGSSTSSDVLIRCRNGVLFTTPSTIDEKR